MSVSNPFILSDRDYKNFELEFDCKMGTAGDAGVYFHLPDGVKSNELAGLYPEMQLVDENGVNVDPIHLTGALNDLIGPKYKISKPSQFNHFRLVVRNGHTEYWLNGIKVTEYDFHSSAWRNNWNSKFGRQPGNAETGRIGFAVQKGSVEYKNIRIREL
jgi:hypothetical protein